MNVIITGATKGIGRAIADNLVKSGHNLFLCARSTADLERVRAELNELGSSNEIHIKKCDVRDRESLSAFGQWCLEISDQIDVLINNAGVFLAGSVLDEPEGQLEQMIETNLYSAFYLSRQIGNEMKNKKSGQIINICSIASEIAYPNGGSYSISKFAMLGMGKVLREELKPHGVRVTNILPGATWSNSWAGAELPESRIMQAADIAKVVAMTINLSDTAVVEDITIRPQLGDL